MREGSRKVRWKGYLGRYQKTEALGKCEGRGPPLGDREEPQRVLGEGVRCSVAWAGHHTSHPLPSLRLLNSNPGLPCCERCCVDVRRLQGSVGRAPHCILGLLSFTFQRTYFFRDSFDEFFFSCQSCLGQR